VLVRGVRFVRSGGFEEVLCVVRDEIEAHEDEEDGHCEADYDFCAFETGRSLVGAESSELDRERSCWGNIPERLPYGAPLPDLEVSQHFYACAEEGADGIVED
jgi:hypothetical protein